MQRSGQQKVAGGAASEGHPHASEAKAINAGKKPADFLDGSRANMIGTPSLRPRHRAIGRIGIVAVESADTPFDAETEA